MGTKQILKFYVEKGIENAMTRATNDKQQYTHNISIGYKYVVAFQRAF